MNIRTAKGTPICRYAPCGVGKLMGDELYVHRLYLPFVTRNDVFPLAAIVQAGHNFLRLNPDWDWRCCRLNLKTCAVRLDEAPDFDTAREPKVGRWFFYSQAPKYQFGHSDAIWHHKWLWVGDLYPKFNVRSSQLWSKRYLSRITGAPKGSARTWAAQLAAVGLK
jgi:hypothetical protein